MRDWVAMVTEAAGDQAITVERRGHDTRLIEHMLEIEHERFCDDRSTLARMLSGISDEQLAAIKQARETATPMREPVGLHCDVRHACGDCAAHSYLFDGLKVIPAAPCPHPHGLLVQVAVNVPSGRLAVGNDFRPQFDVPADSHFDVNSTFGMAQTVEAMAATGCLHPFVGNSSPNLYRVSDDELIIVSPEYDDDGEEVLPDGVDADDEVASICTDLWWVSIADADQAARRGLPAGRISATVDVPAGRWTMDFYGCLRSFDRRADGPVVHASLRRA